MRLFQAALDTCHDSPFFASLSVHGLHFTVYARSIFFDFFGISGPKGPNDPCRGQGGCKSMTLRLLITLTLKALTSLISGSRPFWSSFPIDY